MTTINPGIAENAIVTTPTGRVTSEDQPFFTRVSMWRSVTSRSLSDYVTWQAEFKGMGFDDIRH